ncbi:MAG: hypothetical protein ACRES8_00380 [Nevskiaceae bacterium]
MNPTMRWLVATCLAITSGAAAAHGLERPADSTFTEGWYVAPMATYQSPDSERCAVDDGYGATAALGHRGETASVEIWVQYLELPFGPCTYTVPAPTQVDPDARATVTERGDVKLNGGGVALLVGPFAGEQWLGRLYGIVAFGVMQRANHPHYADDEATIVGDIGAGYLHPLRLWARGVLLRLETRYRYDVQSPPHPDDHDPAPPHSYNDIVVNLGLQIPLSPPEPAAATEPVTVVPVTDSDDDGVPEEFDACPDTAAGASVDATGCVPAATPSPESPTGEAS